MTQTTEGTPRFRIRHDGQTSPWMNADQLKQAAMLGQVPPEAMVQQAGQADWHSDSLEDTLKDIVDDVNWDDLDSENLGE